MCIISTIPFVQSEFGKLATNYINKEYETNILVKKLSISVFGDVNLKNIEIRDHHKDTLIFVNKLQTSLFNINKITDNRLDLNDTYINGAHFYMKTYKGEKENSLDTFIESFGTNKKKDSSTFILKSNIINVKNLNFKILDDNKKDPLQFSAINAGGNIQDFLLKGSDISMKVKGLYLTENRGINIKKLTTDFLYTKRKIELKKIILKTDNKTNIKGNIVFNNDGDYSNFVDKVKFNADFKESKISVKDLNKFYNEIRGHDELYFKGKLNGTLNDFKANDLVVNSKRGMVFRGNTGFKNAIDYNNGFVFTSEIKRLSSNYNQLTNILPNVLGKSIPVEFSRIGNFNLLGDIEINQDKIVADLDMESDAGKANFNLQLADVDDINKAKYEGKIELVNFDLGAMANDSILGKVTLNTDVKGRGFNLESINSKLVGNISKLEFKGYEYNDIKVNGYFQNKKFDGFLLSKDKNFNLEFEGLADFSKEVNKFDFTADIKKLDLQKTNLFIRDDISELKGKIKLDASGNTFDDIVGKAYFEDFTYKNIKKEYTFKKFDISSSLKDSIRTINVNSKDIIEGSLEGRFSFVDLVPITKNALGSVYAHYTPVKVTTPNQFINFNFTIYNQIVDVFFPEVSIAPNTRFKGKIDSNKNSVKLNFESSKIELYENIIDKIELRLDNKNKLYNTHLTADKIKSKYYSIDKFNLLNRTINDTLFFKTSFKEGIKKIDDYNLSFFYTIDKNNKSVVGLEKSLINYKGNKWLINPENNKDNKVLFDLKDKSFVFSPFLMISNNQKIEFSGDLKGNNYKNLKGNFTDVTLKSFLPEIKNLALEGVLNGEVSVRQNKGNIQPVVDIEIKDIVVNEFSQGILKAKIEGDNSYDKYKVDISLRDYDYDNIKVEGGLDFSKKEPIMDLSVKLKDYELDAFSNLGEGVIENIRGRVSGNFTSKGSLTNPSFIFKNIVLQDTKYDTKGYLSGDILHKDFEKWYLDLKMDTPNLLVLDTKEVDEIPYYGKVFLRGGAKIKGATSNLDIDVVGKTEKDTKLVIPLNDVTTLNNFNLIHFTGGDKRKTERKIRNIEGLSLNMNIDVTKDAVAQVVIDKVSGSELKGRGTGNLLIEIDTKGTFLMNGDLTIDEGEYNFKYSGISKKFDVKKGGTISWNGNPYDTELDLIAIYHTKANPAQILNNISLNRKIPVELYTKITGNLFSSDQEFDIKLSNVNSEISSELEFVLNNGNENNKMLNFFSLLLTGSFYNEKTFASNVASDLGIGTASEMFSNLLSDIINSDDDKFKLGVNYSQGRTNYITGIRTDNQLDVSVSSQFNKKIFINGKVGIPVGAKTETGVVGEVRAEVLLNKKGTARWSVFNKPNDIQYSIEEEGYTQGMGISYQVDFDDIKDLKNQILKKKENKKAERDTILETKELINFKSVKKDRIKDNEKNN